MCIERIDYGESINHGPESLGSMIKASLDARTRKILKSDKNS